jgi:hypothetical protein
LTSGNYASLSAAVTAIGSTSTRLLINEAITIAADLTVPANIILERVEPGSITVNPGVTLTLVSAPLSDATQWFLGSGTVAITGYPQDRAWWGEAERIDAGGFNIKAASVLASPYTVQNLSFTATVSSKALTVSLKGIDGNAPSATNPINIAFRSATATSSVTVLRTVTSATSVVLSSGSTLGFSAALTSKIYVWAIDYAGTVELALSKSVNWSPTVLVTTTAEGGAGGADSATTIYSATQRTNVACRLIGWLTIQTGATPGEWDNAPTLLNMVQDTNGTLTDVTLGAQYYVLVSNGTTSAPTFQQIVTGGLADLSVSQAKLKTTVASVTVACAAGTYYTPVIPGGEYGFGVKVGYVHEGGTGTAKFAGLCVEEANVLDTWQTPTAKFVVTSSGGTGTAYCQVRYVTSSGEVNWVFFLRNRATKLIEKSYVSQDHPCMGSGGKPALTPHPFGNYDQDKYELIVINPTNEEWAAYEAAAIDDDPNTPDRSIAQVILEDYEIDEGSKAEWPTTAVTVGLPKTIEVQGKKQPVDWRTMPSGTSVTPIKAVIQKPSNVLCKSLISKTAVIEEVKG